MLYRDAHASIAGVAKRAASITTLGKLHILGVGEVDLVVRVEGCVVLCGVAGNGLDGRAVLALGTADDSLDGGVDGRAGRVFATAEAGRKVAAALLKICISSTDFIRP